MRDAEKSTAPAPSKSSKITWLFLLLFLLFLGMRHVWCTPKNNIRKTTVLLAVSRPSKLRDFPDSLKSLATSAVGSYCFVIIFFRIKVLISEKRFVFSNPGVGFNISFFYEYIIRCLGNILGFLYALKTNSFKTCKT